MYLCAKINVLQIKDIFSLYKSDFRFNNLIEELEKSGQSRIKISGVSGSFYAFVGYVVAKKLSSSHIFILPDREKAAYLFNDLENLFADQYKETQDKKVLFYPSSYKRVNDFEHQDPQNILFRTEVLNRLGSEAGRKSVIVTYPAAVSELITDRSFIRKNTVKVSVHQNLFPDTLADRLLELHFERVDFVYEPGQFSVRGGIIDVYSFSEENPIRIEFYGDEIASIRSFHPVTQISYTQLEKVNLLPNIQDRNLVQSRKNFVSALPAKSVIWLEDYDLIRSTIAEQIQNAEASLSGNDGGLVPSDFLVQESSFLKALFDYRLVISGSTDFNCNSNISFGVSPQPVFNKNFDLLSDKLKENTSNGVTTFLLSENEKQQERIKNIFHDLLGEESGQYYSIVPLTLHEGFSDDTGALAFYTDHQIFDRYHRYRIHEGKNIRESLNIKELTGLSPGDYITHIEYGIGRFDGLEKINNNGNEQEAIRIIYGNSDLLYVNIHSLHRISKYVGKEGTPPKLHRLGSTAWKTLKNKTKSRVKDIAKELIELYAKRKSSDGFQFSLDTYLQNELEASFIYEDTPDQYKATNDIKADMEKPYPMDRLVCGDVGFGKTEVAIRAAFKAVADNKQVALLVPTTILALQHYHTLSNRLKDFPCRVEYINRFRTTKEVRQILADLKEGKVDILIGTHRIVSKDVHFKDLGLLIVDEEQKFGVSVKEKLKHLRVNVDTLTLTATPIPRTLQFSMLGARDLSIINTPPPNRYPVQTEVISFDSTMIRDAINYELARGGQVFFVHNRVQNIMDVAVMIEKFVPGVRIVVGHGQMEGRQLEKVMLDFIEGKFDVLLSTTIIESGLDIPNVNTIIINDAQNYGLSDLHQLRGRVGRTNKKAFCYLMSPPLVSLSDDARKRLRAIEEFSVLGSGFNIAMRDLDIRGAGNLLGAEQSGFITDIGFDMYQKILDEAMLELRDSDPQFLKDQSLEEVTWVRDCVLETDLELLLPDSYVTNITERLSLYRALENTTTEEELSTFSKNLEDRFGPVPEQTEELIYTVKLRRLARDAGFEKILLKNGRLTGYFISNPESPYFQTNLFGKVLTYIQANADKCVIKERNAKLSLVFFDVTSVRKAISLLSPLCNAVQQV